MVLAVLIVGVAITTTVLVQGGLGRPVPAPTSGQVTETNWSTFTESGLAYIDQSRRVQIDFSEVPVDAAELGLPADGSLTIGPKYSGDVPLDYYFIVFGGGEKPAGDRFTVSQLTIDTAGGQIIAVRAPLSERGNFRQNLDALVPRAEEFGWAAPDLDLIYTTAGDAARQGDPFEVTFGPGERLGVAVSATLRCDPSAQCGTEYTVGPAVR